MQETAQAFFDLDEHANGAVMPKADVRLSGWALAKPGYFFTDLRVRVGRMVHPACYGHPRTDLAQYFKAREPFLLAGFEVGLALLPGENRLEFEACEIVGQWLPVATVVLVGPASNNAPAAPTGVVQPHEFARALRLVLQGAASEPVDDAAGRVAGLLPLPHVTRYPALPFHGHLHNPPMLQRTEFGRVVVEGWLFHETEEIRSVAASVDLQAWQRLEQEGAFPYVAGQFPQFPHATACRIYGTVDVPAQLPQPLSLRVYAELTDGSWHLCHVERCHLYGDEQDKQAYARFSLVTFARGVRSLRTACLKHGFAVPMDKWFLRALHELWREYRDRAPRRAQPAPDSPALPAPAGTKLPGKIVLITHNLNFEGAPLFLLEYGGYLAGHGAKLSVISAADGPLRTKFEAFGATVEIVDVAPLLKAENARALRAALRALAPQLDLARADLVVANTLSAFWGVHLARMAGRRSLFYLHESTTPESFYFGYMAPATLPVVRETFALAAHVSFLTGATRRYYQPHLTRANHSINAGWIDLTAVDRFVAENPRPQRRDRLAIPSATRLVVDIGTVCNRKGQHIFARAVDLLWRRRPDLAGQCEFLMVGGRDSAYDRAVASLLKDLNRANLRVVPETSTPYDYYGSADLFVCSSYEESFPRVLLEAMAFAVPIVSTDVHGIPEIVRPDLEAVLVPPGDSSALAAAMARMLDDDRFARSLADRGRARVAANYDSALLLPRHANLARTVAALPD